MEGGIQISLNINCYPAYLSTIYEKLYDCLKKEYVLYEKVTQ